MVCVHDNADADAHADGRAHLATNAGAADTAVAAAAATSKFVKVTQKPNKNGPLEQFQVTQDLLYEREFGGTTYISAHLNRLQNGIYLHHRNSHKTDVTYVTFVSIRFTFHPSLSKTHRFRSAILEIHARGADNEYCRFLKIAPTMLYGRISTESLKWNFQLGAKLGVTQGPADVCVTPSMSYDKCKVQGTMMKIQGSTRTTTKSHVFKHEEVEKKHDTKLVWSIEENDQQETGLPREFSFCFLLERPHNPFHHAPGHDPSQAPTDLAARVKVIAPVVFSPLTFSVKIVPEISEFPDAIAELINKTDETTISEQIGQRFPTEAFEGCESKTDPEAMLGEFYNFAKLPGSFEDLIELPGNAVTTLEPPLPNDKC